MENQGKPVCFGQRYAILQLDWTTLMCGIDESPRGKSMIESCMRWNDAIHSKMERPLTIFTTLAFRRGSHEVAPNSAFAKLVARFGSFEEGSQSVEIDPRFQRDEKDLILCKTRLSATSGSNLEQILRAKGVDTVVVSGLSLSGVIMSTIYRLYDLDFNIFVIRDCVLEPQVDRHEAMATVMLDMVIPTMGLSVISLDQALEALGT